MSAFEIRCAQCSEPTGAWFIGGDPFLPLIVCATCHDAEDAGEPPQ